MEKTLELLESFEEINNISTTLILMSDGSGTVEEFWNKEELKEFKSVIDLHDFLRYTQYELDENGRCFSPVRKKPIPCNNCQGGGCPVCSGGGFISY